jgi:tetratricopeptide (TPR) repeat protein
VSNALDRLAGLCRNLGDVQKAVVYREKSLGILRGYGNAEFEHNTLTELATDYRELKNYPKVVETYQRIADLWKTGGYQSELYLYAEMNLAASLEDNEHLSGQKSFDTLIKILKKQHNKRAQEYLFKKYAEALKRQGHPKEAAGFLKKVRKSS